MLVNPTCHVLLPLLYWAVGVVGVSIRLGERVDVLRVRLAALLVATPPVHKPLVALLEVIVKHRVQKVLALVAVAVDEAHCSLTLIYLAVGVAPEADAAV